jgi:hypothetical protein
MTSGRSGAEEGTRTPDLLITNQLLYQLSYFGIQNGDAEVSVAFMERVTGIEPALSAWEAEVLPLNYTRVDSHGLLYALAWLNASRQPKEKSGVLASTPLLVSDQLYTLKTSDR